MVSDFIDKEELNVGHKLYLSIDNGASGGRAILGKINEKKLVIEEINRYHNQMIRVFDHCYWDILTLFQNVKIH